jgi:hypothetical protein
MSLKDEAVETWGGLVASCDLNYRIETSHLIQNQIFFSGNNAIMREH